MGVRVLSVNPHTARLAPCTQSQSSNPSPGSHSQQSIHIVLPIRLRDLRFDSKPVHEICSGYNLITTDTTMQISANM